LLPISQENCPVTHNNQDNHDVSPEKATSSETNEKMATVSLVCGIVALAYPSFITGPIGSVAAIVTGILGLRSEKRGRAIAGMVLAGLALVIFCVLTYLEVSTNRALDNLLQSRAFP
jgi:hypothetical protein